ncbi:MAG: hypothetical protein SFY32_17535 [Bacteroidota bacterium]|nr:hypothetical protein [Bacteroidota bacterium]
MLKLFKYTGPVQLISILVLIYIIRLPLFFMTPPLLLEDMYHMLVGEKLANGFLLYRDILTSTPPIPAFIYWLINLLFGKSHTAFFVFSSFFAISQVLIFRYLSNNNELFSAKSDIPTLIYAVSTIVCYDFMSLSPAMISVTFILMAFNNIFRHIKAENNEGEIFATGFYIGLAYLCFAPAFIFLLMAFMSFILFTRTVFRYYMLLLMGFCFPIITLMVFFYWNDGLSSFINCYLFNFPQMALFSGKFNLSIVSVIIFPSLIMVLLGISKAFTYTRFINFQMLCNQILFAWMSITLFVIILFFSKTVSSFYLITPFAAYYISHYILLSKRKWISEVLFVIMFIIALQFCYSILKIGKINQQNLAFNNQIIWPEMDLPLLKNKRILVLGDSIELYKQSSLATPFLDWSLSKKVLVSMDKFSCVETTYDSFINEKPELVIDLNNLMPKIQSRIVPIGNMYQKIGNSNMYKLVNER